MPDYVLGAQRLQVQSGCAGVRAVTRKCSAGAGSCGRRHSKRLRHRGEAAGARTRTGLRPPIQTRSVPRDASNRNCPYPSRRPSPPCDRIPICFRRRSGKSVRSPRQRPRVASPLPPRSSGSRRGPGLRAADQAAGPPRLPTPLCRSALRPGSVQERELVGHQQDLGVLLHRGQRLLPGWREALFRAPGSGLGAGLALLLSQHFFDLRRPRETVGLVVAERIHGEIQQLPFGHVEVSDRCLGPRIP